MKLYPALLINGKVHKGAADDSHMTLGESIGIPSPPENTRGFTPDGKTFLTRTKAIGFLKKHDRDTYNKLPREAQRGIHSQHLADAYGVKQKESLDDLPKESLLQSSTGILGQSRKLDRQQTGGLGEVGHESVPRLSDKTAIVYDRGGLSLYCAEKLAEKYKKVMYYMAESDSYPTSQKHDIGIGIKGVTRIYDFWKYIDESDICYFFDVGDGELQHWLRSKGYIVYGTGRSEQLELDKIGFLEHLEKLGLPCPKTYLAEGLDDLCEYLKKHDGQTLFLKNLHRGDFESKRFKSMAQLKPFLNDLKKRLGTACDRLEVLVQHKIDAECEAGTDTFCIDGEYPTKCICGYECKDVAYAGKVMSEEPEILKQINQSFSPLQKKFGGRGNLSTEVRITSKGEAYYIDPTERIPSPPGEVMCEVYENWAEATWLIANGIVPELEEKAKFVAEVILCSQWNEDHELHVKFPKRFKQNIKLKNYKIVDGEYYCVPNNNGSFFGAAVAWGDTLREAIENVKEVAESIEADEYTFDDSCFDDIAESIRSGREFGIKI